MKALAQTLLSHRSVWLGLASLLLLLDYFTSAAIQFPITFIFPVMLAAWHRRPLWAIAFAILLPLGRFGFIFLWKDAPWPVSVSLINLFIRISVLSILAKMTLSVAKQHCELQKKYWRLEGLLPICMNCKRIRDEKNQWQSFESYLTTHTEVVFGHAHCPDYRVNTSSVGEEHDLLAHYE